MTTTITNIVPVSEARDRLTELLSDTSDHDVILLKHGRPVGVLMSVERYESMMAKAEEIDDVMASRQPGDYIPFVRSTARSDESLAA